MAPLEAAIWSMNDLGAQLKITIHSIIPRKLGLWPNLMLFMCRLHILSLRVLHLSGNQYSLMHLNRSGTSWLWRVKISWFVNNKTMGLIMTNHVLSLRSPNLLGKIPFFHAVCQLRFATDKVKSNQKVPSNSKKASQRHNVTFQIA